MFDVRGLRFDVTSNLKHPTMRYSKWLGLLAALALIVTAFFPWVIIESKNLTLTGIDTSGTSYGKPAYFHFVLAGIFLVCTFTQRVWAKRLNLLVTGLNLGWAIRNFLILGNCMGGECPVRKTGIWLMLAASILMLISSFFPDIKLPAKNKNLD